MACRPRAPIWHAHCGCANARASISICARSSVRATCNSSPASRAASACCMARRSRLKRLPAWPLLPPPPPPPPTRCCCRSMDASPPAQPLNGQLVVARLGDEATVKYYRRRGSVLRLEPANPDFAPLEIDLRRQACEIEGIVVGVVRTELTRRG